MLIISHPPYMFYNYNIILYLKMISAIDIIIYAL
jgi:hypothetical protein